MCDSSLHPGTMLAMFAGELMGFVSSLLLVLWVAMRLIRTAIKPFLESL